MSQGLRSEKPKASVAACMQGTGCDLRVWHVEEALPIAHLGEACVQAPLTAAAFEAGERLVNPNWQHGVRLAACSAAQARCETLILAACSMAQARSYALKSGRWQRNAGAF